MRMRLVAAMMLVASVATAQEHKRVEVTTLYTPELAASSKIVAPATIADRPEIEPDIRYGINPDTWQIELEDHDFKPATAGYWDFGRARRFYTELAGGYPLASDATLRFASGNVRAGFFGVGVEHDGSYSPRENVMGVVRNMASSYDMRNRAYLHGGVITGCQVLEVTADYDFDIYNRYAELGDDPARLMFHDVDLQVRYGDNFADLTRLNFGIEAHGGYWSHVPPHFAQDRDATPEFSAGGSVRLARAMGENVVGLRAVYDTWQSTYSSYRDMRFGVTAEYSRHFGIIDLEAALGYIYDRVRDREKASHFVTPRLKMLFDFGLKAIVPYVEFDTSVSQNGLAALYGANPYLDSHASSDALLAMPSTRSYNLSIGFNGSAASSRLAYRLYLGANFMRDEVVWYVNSVGMFGVATGSNNRLFVGAEISYQPVGGLLIAASVYARANNSDAEYYVNDANINADLEVEYSIKRWRFYAMGEVIGRRNWSCVADVEGATTDIFTAPLTVDLRAGISFRASRMVEIYADGYNLLNSRIYDYAYYYRNGAGFMAGVKIDF